MSKSGKQTNDINARNVIGQLLGHVVGEHEYVDPHMHPASPNQRVEAAAAMVGSNDPAIQTRGVAMSLEFLAMQKSQGFQCVLGANEVLTNSHSAIWLRAMTALLLFTWKLKDSDIKSHLLSLAYDWWESWRALNSLGMVPSGPLAGQSVLPCARLTGLPGKLENIKVAGDDVTASFYSLSSGGKLRKGLNKKALVLNLARPDTAAIALVSRVISGPTFGSNFTRETLPKLATRLIVERGPAGHTASFPDGAPGVDGVASCWAEYGTGRFSFTGDSAPFNTDHRIEVERV